MGKNRIFCLILLLLILTIPQVSLSKDTVKLYLFYSEETGGLKVNDEIIRPLLKNYPVEIQSFSVNQLKNYDLLIKFEKELKVAEKELPVDLSLPVGKIEGNTLNGIRYPFKVSLPSSQWQFSLEIPDFMEGLGFKRPGLEESELFIINPATRSNIQTDLTPAGRRVRFDQKLIETLTRSVAGGLVEELKMEHGRDFPVEVGPTTPYALKGVPYAAHRSARYKVEGRNTIHGWVYGFAEPYQIFIIYMLLEKEGFDDLKDIMKILDSFEMISRK